MTFDCPICKRSLESDDDLVGTEVQCPNCGRFIQIPSHEAPALPSPPPPPQSPAPVIRTQQAASQPIQVVVTDIRMPFASMVTFMVKLVFAAIPAFIILGMCYLFFALLFLGGCAALFTGAALQGLPGGPP